MEAREQVNQKIACIGSGNMGRALMRGAVQSTDGKNIVFTDHTLAKAQAAADEIGGTVRPSASDAASIADIVFLAVKPAGIMTALHEIAPFFTETKVVVSMAAGVSLEQLRSGIAAGKSRMPQLIRIMPNTPALIGKGVIALAAPPATPPEAVEMIRGLLAGAGMVDVVDEKYMDAITALSGSGPAFAYLFMEALADGGVCAGLPRDKALQYAARTVEGAAAMVTLTGKHPGILKDEVASPGGTTIRGIEALETRAFRGAVMSAVRAAYEACRH
jgi:pyrroline-5-carboxylate reductase